MIKTSLYQITAPLRAFLVSKESFKREDLGEGGKADPEGLSIRPCVWPVGNRSYPRSFLPVTLPTASFFFFDHLKPKIDLTLRTTL